MASAQVALDAHGQLAVRVMRCRHVALLGLLVPLLLLFSVLPLQQLLGDHQVVALLLVYVGEVIDLELQELLYLTLNSLRFDPIL